jgi:hypothetical protein
VNKIAKVVLFTVILFFIQVNLSNGEMIIIVNSDNLGKFFSDLEKINEALQKWAEKTESYDSQNDKQTLVIDLERSKSFIKEGKRLLNRIDYDTQQISENHHKAVNIIVDVSEIQNNALVKLKELRAKN